MNPKKRIMERLINPPCRHPAGESCEACDRVRRLVEGMSAGTATLVLRNAVNEKFADDVAIEGLANRGRYYTASIVDAKGTVLQNLLVDKQTGDVRFV